MKRETAIELLKDPDHPQFTEAMEYVIFNHPDQSLVEWFAGVVAKPRSKQRDIELKVGYANIKRWGVSPDEYYKTPDDL